MKITRGELLKLIFQNCYFMLQEMERITDAQIAALNYECWLEDYLKWYASVNPFERLHRGKESPPSK